MAKNVKWQDDYWLLLMQLYLQKPIGIKPMYSRKMVDLSMELHISPAMLFNKMCQIANIETPRIEHIWETYGNNPRKLARATSLLRGMKGFNNASEFYEGVEVSESFEKDFKPIAEDEKFTPVMLKSSESARGNNLYILQLCLALHLIYDVLGLTNLSVNKSCLH